MHRMRQQNGFAMQTVLFTMVLVGVAVFLIFKLVPVYLEHFGVVSSLESMADEIGLHRKTPKQLMTLLKKRFGINDVTRITKEDVTIKRQRQETRINVAYEVQVSLVGNIALLMTFDNTVALH